MPSEKTKKHTIYMREWNARNREKVRAQARKSYYENAETKKAYQRAYNAAHADEINERRREERRLYARSYRTRNPDIVNAQIMRRRARLCGAPGWKYTTAALIQQRWNMWGGRCRYCGTIASTTDHRIPLSRGGSHFPSNLVPACKRCNFSKGRKTEREFITSRSGREVAFA